MSRAEVTKCDACGETTTEKFPSVSKGWFEIEIEGKPEDIERDACSVKCLVAVLRQLADEHDSPPKTKGPYR